MAQSDESQSPESPTPFSRKVGESRSRISKPSYEKLAEVLGIYHRWPKTRRVRVPNLQHRFPEVSRGVGESESRISNTVFSMRWRVEVPNLKAKLRKVSGSPRNISSLAQSAESQSPESPTAFSPCVGESKSRISKLSYEKLAEFVGKFCVGPKRRESESRISNTVFPKRWRVKVPNPESQS